MLFSLLLLSAHSLVLSVSNFYFSLTLVECIYGTPYQNRCLSAFQSLHSLTPFSPLFSFSCTLTHSFLVTLPRHCFVSCHFSSTPNNRVSTDKFFNLSIYSSSPQFILESFFHFFHFLRILTYPYMLIRGITFIWTLKMLWFSSGYSLPS